MNATQELAPRQQRACSEFSRPPTPMAPAPVRVCFLIDELALAGTETQLLALIRGFDRSRVLPFICLLRTGDPRARLLEPDDIPVHRLGVDALARPSTIPSAWRFLRFLRSERVDILQAYFPDSTYFGIPLGWLARVPCRIRTRNNVGHWLTPLHRFFGRLLNGLTTHTIANCAAAKVALIEHEHPDPERVFVLESGVDLERFAHLADPVRNNTADMATVGAVANLRPVKGLEILVEAARRLVTCFPNVRFRVAGDGPERPALEQLIHQNNLAGKFDLVGSVRDIPAFLSQLDVAVLCSRAEGMPNCVLEYMAAARPLVATAVGAVEELVKDGVHGLVVPPGDPASLANAIARLLQNPRLAVTMGHAARDHVRRHYSREAMVRRFERFYQAIARPSTTRD